LPERTIYRDLYLPLSEIKGRLEQPRKDAGLDPAAI
jgi:hypothetical protein